MGYITDAAGVLGENSCHKPCKNYFGSDGELHMDLMHTSYLFNVKTFTGFNYEL